jgi:hypothetical protein
MVLSYVACTRVCTQETGGVNLFKKGWYTEYDPQKLEWKDACFSIEMEEVLYHKRSLYQDVLVFRR